MDASGSYLGPTGAKNALVCTLSGMAPPIRMSAQL